MEYNKKRSKKSWNEIYREGTKRVECTLVVDEDIPGITDLLKKRNIKKIFDLGCGAGRITVYLAQKGFDVYGIDLSEEGIKKAKQQLTEMGLHADLKIHSMIDTLPYPDNFFDAVISTRTIHHAKIEQIRNIIMEIERVLKPHGLIFITVRKSNLKKKISYAKKVAPRTFVNIEGKEKGVTHYIFNRNLLRKEFRNFKICELWVDSKRYYCLLGELKNKRR
ncbi:MAG: class I SAM-dependent methyltransferase [Thermoplasmatales archaeon]|nr:class I SAM-dependent methyltransferase [Thermoplasmatales archaeon]